MALTRSALRERGITEKEILDFVMEEHGNAIEATKEKAKESADRTAEGLQATIDTLQEQVDAAPKADPDGKDYKAELETLQAKYTTDIAAKDTELAEYKSGVEAKATTAAIMSDIEARLLKDGAKPSLVKLLLKEVDSSKADYKDGTVANYDDLTKTLKEGYADVFGTTQTKGADVADPPAGESKESDPFAEGFDSKK